MTRGWIKIALEKLPSGDLRIEIQDSGAGFDYTAKPKEQTGARADASSLSGRSVALVREICREVYYHGSDNHVIAIFPMRGRAVVDSTREGQA